MNQFKVIIPANLRDNSLLTIIIPFRLSNERPDILNRLEYLKQDQFIPNNIDFLLVDDGSSSGQTDSIINKCRKLKINYMRLSSESNPFSIARARNYGAMYARSEYIMYIDADLMVTDRFYEQVLEEIELNDLKNNSNDFLGFSVIYLTKKELRFL